MFFEEKLEAINNLIDSLNKEDTILVWGTGLHTDELMKYTKLSLFGSLLFTSKEHRDDTYYGRPLLSKNELDYNLIECIIISSWKFQDEIEQEIINSGFKKKIIKFYTTKNEGEFFRLPRLENHMSFYFSGSYATWESACDDQGGYNKPSILAKVYDATLQVINGEARYERDSCVFYEPAYTYHLLALIGILCCGRQTVSVLDFGGSLGTLYWQNKEMLGQCVGKNIIWQIVEQPNYVRCGREKIQNDEISFWENIEEIERADLVIFSGVLQYLENYREIIQKALKFKPQYILIDRLCTAKKGRIVRQYVDERIYKAFYPVRIFEKSEIVSLLEGYCLKAEFPSLVDGEMYVDELKIDSKGMIFQLE